MKLGVCETPHPHNPEGIESMNNNSGGLYLNSSVPPGLEGSWVFVTPQFHWGLFTFTPLREKKVRVLMIMD
jgi:hypothetical protein